jgi:hypothetical protein
VDGAGVNSSLNRAASSDVDEVPARTIVKQGKRTIESTSESSSGPREFEFMKI